jgi:hypothetical protein
MKKASEYRRHAAECLALARGMRNAEHREQLLKMAKTWTNLADDRDRFTKLQQQLQTEPSLDGGDNLRPKPRE